MRLGENNENLSCVTTKIILRVVFLRAKATPSDSLKDSAQVTPRALTGAP